MTQLPDGMDFDGDWIDYTPTLVSLATTGADPVDQPDVGANTEVTGAYTRESRTVTGRFQFRMGSDFEPSTELGAYAVELPVKPFHIDDPSLQGKEVPQPVGAGWASEETGAGDEYHLFTLVHDPPFTVDDLDEVMAIMFIHDGIFGNSFEGNPVGRGGSPPVGVPFEFGTGDVLAGWFSYEAMPEL